MTPWTRFLRTLGAAAVAVSFVLAGGSGNLVLANGTGDLYVADPKVVLELNSQLQSVDHVIEVPPAQAPSASAGVTSGPSAAASTCAGGAQPAAVSAPTELAFSDLVQTPGSQTDRYLFTANRTKDVYRVRISDLCVFGPTTVKANVLAIGHPSGNSLYVSTDGSDTLTYVNDNTSTAQDGARMSKGSPDILAADLRDSHVVAARKGETWVAIVDAAGTVTYVRPPGGSFGPVVAAAIARDEGAAWVVTTTAVSRVDLATHLVTFTKPLPGTPTTVVALAKFAVVAIGKQLYRVDGSGANLWATEPSPVLQLATDINAGYVYAGTATQVLALSVAAPTKPAASTIDLPNGAPGAFAAIPDRPSNLPAVKGSAALGVAGNSSATGTGKPRKTHPPSTDTVSDLVGGRGPGADLTTALLVGGTLVIGVTLGSRLLIKRLIGE